MRVSLWLDMEGVARITNHRECWPPFRQYWESGRQKLTDDVVAAASGLLEGGADEITVVNAHGLGWPNLLWDQLPAGARPAGDDWKEADAIFQIGFHARFGTGAGFLSHTMVPNLEVAVDGNRVTESHIWGWVMGVPVLGVVGDAALGSQLDGWLRGTPFLAVKRSSSRSETTPLFPEREASAVAVRTFAQECVTASWPAPPVLPGRFEVTLSLDPERAERVEEQHGLVRKSAGALSVEAESWNDDAQPALEVAMGAALQPFFDAQGDLDVTSEEAMDRQDPEELQRCRRFFEDWVGDGSAAP